MVLLLLAAFVGGCCVGSFLNVLIVRLPDPTRTLFRPRRSACPRCDAAIRAWDNVPVVSWCLLRGRCRHCRLPISPMYPAVEVASGLLWAWATWAYALPGHPDTAVLAISFGTLLLGAGVTDARTMLLPNVYTYGGIALGLVATAAQHAIRLDPARHVRPEAWPMFGYAMAPAVTSLVQRGLEAAALFALLALLGTVMRRLLTRDALGDGDPYLVAMIASVLGFGPALLALWAAACSGLVWNVVVRRTGRQTEVPFGSHLALGAAVAWFLADTPYAVLLSHVFPWN